MKSIVIFGGSGFIGKHLIRRLAKNGHKIIVPYQRSIQEAKIRLLGVTGQVIPFRYHSLKNERLQSVLINGDVVKIITSKSVSPSLHWLTSTKTGKARAAIRRYWQYREDTKPTKIKKYNTTLWISLPDEPGKLGDVTTMIGTNNVNISSVEMVEKTKNSINFRFNLIIHDLKNFTKLISELKQKEYNFKIIRHKNKKYAFFKRLFGGFKKN